MKKLFFETEKDGFYGTYYENPKGSDCAVIGMFSMKVAAYLQPFTDKLITKKAEEAVQKANLPAKGKFSQGDTLNSLYKDAKIEWEGTLASVKTGFSISKGGIASIFMIYGTPRRMKNQKMYKTLGVVVGLVFVIILI